MTSTGYCRICGCYGVLTQDHIPPKKASILRNVEMKTLTRYLSDRQEHHRSRFYQNGVYFPALCHKCNNERLGHNYDPALIDVSKKMRTIARAHQNNALKLPPETICPMKVYKVARAIVGHLLTVEQKGHFNQPLEHAPFPDAMRDYFLDESKSLPDKMNIYYWLYPSNISVVGRGFGIMNLNWPGVIVADVIKFFPLAFLVTWEEPPEARILQSKLITDRSTNIDEIKDVRISLRNLPHLGWPEQNPGDSGLNLVVDERTFVAYERKPKHLSVGSSR